MHFSPSSGTSSTPGSASDISGTAPLSSLEMEKVILEWSRLIARLQLEAARDYVDGFRSKRPVITNPRDSAWHALLNAAAALSQAERAYFSLSRSAPPKALAILLKKDSLKSFYEQIRQELAKSADQVKTTVTDTDTLAEHLLRQFYAIAGARMDMLDVYEQLSIIGTLNNSRGIVSQIEKVIQNLDSITTQHSFHHPSIATIEAQCSLEVDILKSLLECQLMLAEHQVSYLYQCRNKYWTVLPSLLSLKEIRDRIKTWLDKADLHPSITKSPSFFRFGSSSKSTHSVALCFWMHNFYELLLSKFSLYFHDVMAPMTTLNEMRQSISNLPAPNLIQRFQNFHRKYDPLFFCIMVDRCNDPGPFQGFYCRLMKMIFFVQGFGYVCSPQRWSGESTTPVLSPTSSNVSSFGALNEKLPVLYRQTSERQSSGDRIAPAIHKTIADLIRDQLGNGDRISHQVADKVVSIVFFD